MTMKQATNITQAEHEPYVTHCRIIGIIMDAFGVYPIPGMQPHTGGRVFYKPEGKWHLTAAIKEYVTLRTQLLENRADELRKEQERLHTAPTKFLRGSVYTNSMFQPNKEATVTTSTRTSTTKHQELNHRPDDADEQLLISLQKLRDKRPRLELNTAPVTRLFNQNPQEVENGYDDETGTRKNVNNVEYETTMSTLSRRR
jgi:hypothetical protein